jgi:hypothetical protein
MATETKATSPETVDAVAKNAVMNDLIAKMGEFSDFIRIQNGHLIMKVKLDSPRASASGKSDILATSGGAVNLGNDTKLNYTLYKTRPTMKS